jgi:hypothetical protein
MDLDTLEQTADVYSNYTIYASKVFTVRYVFPIFAPIDCLTSLQDTDRSESYA